MILTITLHRSDKPDEPLIKLYMPADRVGKLYWNLGQDADLDLIEITDAEILRYRAFEFMFVPLVIREPRERVVKEEKSEVLMTGRKFRLSDKNL